MSGSSSAEAEIRISALAERANISEGGKRFRSKFIEPGVVSYKDIGAGYELLRKETIDACVQSMKGAALTIDHPAGDTIIKGDFTDVSHGVIDKVEYDSASGWYVCEGTVETEEARKRIEAGDGVSCGFTVTQRANGGTKNGIPYQSENTKVNFHHLAIVPPDKRARYEEAAIRLNSMKTPNFAAKLIQKFTGGDRTVELTPKSGTTIDGKFVSFEDMIAVENQRANALDAIVPGSVIQFEGKEYDAVKLAEGWKAANRGAPSETAEQKATREAQERANAKAAPGEVTLAVETEINGVKFAPGKYTFAAAAPVLTAETRAAQERSNAEAHIAQRLSEERAAGAAEGRAAAERENAGRQSFALLHGAADRRAAEAAAPVYEMGGSGSLDDGVALGLERYGREATGRQVATVSHGKN